MGIGGALAEARSEAGMTVDQVSDRTRIRSTIIRAIERDDYAVCGGDFYARGHIRAIAHVVGTDPVPLIEQYDIAHSPPPPPPDEATAHRTSGLWLHTLEREPARGGQLAANGAASAARQTANRPDNGWARPGGITAAEAFRPVMPLRLQGTRRVPVRRAVVSLIVLAVVAVLAYLLAAGGGAPVPARSHHPPARGPQHSAASHRSPAAAASVTARYVLVWFTQLPPDSTGTYQADVYNVSVSGAG